MHTKWALPIVSMLTVIAVAAALYPLGTQAVNPPVFNGGGLIEGRRQAETALEDSGIRTETDIVVVIANIINFALGFAAIAAFITFIVAGFMFILGFGSDQTIQRARKIMIWSVVGLLVILFAIVITRFVIDFGSAT